MSRETFIVYDTTTGQIKFSGAGYTGIAAKYNVPASNINYILATMDKTPSTHFVDLTGAPTLTAKAASTVTAGTVVDNQDGTWTIPLSGIVTAGAFLSLEFEGQLQQWDIALTETTADVVVNSAGTYYLTVYSIPQLSKTIQVEV